ncbi:MAG: hypothetical protein CMJ90_18550 [Planctomycetes bacterium]|nr:hypothetical protein [Planctomycetota bacterium]
MRATNWHLIIACRHTPLIATITAPEAVTFFFYILQCLTVIKLIEWEMESFDSTGKRFFRRP